jgi:hypothetical protein
VQTLPACEPKKHRGKDDHDDDDSHGRNDHDD